MANDYFGIKENISSPDPEINAAISPDTDNKAAIHETFEQLCTETLAPINEIETSEPMNLPETLVPINQPEILAPAVLETEVKDVKGKYIDMVQMLVCISSLSETGG